MVQLQSKTSEIMAQGRRERRNWNPEPDSPHLKVYRWWATHGGAAPLTENFCHYWRVVAIWAPLRWLTQPFRTRTGKRCLLGLGAIAIALLITFLTIRHLTGAGIIGLIIGCLAEFIFGIWMAGYYTALITKSGGSHALNDRSYGLVALLTLLTFPVLVCFALVWAVSAMIFSLFDEFEIQRFIFGYKLAPVRGLRWLTPFYAACIVALAVLVFTAPAHHGSFVFLMVILVITGAILAFVGVIMLISWLSDKSQRKATERRELADERRRERERQLDDLLNEWSVRRNRRILRKLFNELHPKRAGSQYCFERWLKRLCQRIHFHYTVEEFLTLSPGHIFDYLHPHHQRLLMKCRIVDRSRLEDEYWSEQNRIRGVRPVPQPRTRRIRTAYRTVVSFLALLWAFILTRKWKICPMVSLPGSPENDLA